MELLHPKTIQEVLTPLSLALVERLHPGGLSEELPLPKTLLEALRLINPRAKELRLLKQLLGGSLPPNRPPEELLSLRPSLTQPLQTPKKLA